MRGKFCTQHSALFEEPFTKAQLKGLLKKAGLKPSEVLRTKEEIYKKLGLARKQLTDDQLLDLMIKHPDLIQRPLVEMGEKVILARPAEAVKKLLLRPEHLTDHLPEAYLYDLQTNGQIGSSRGGGLCGGQLL